jgi:hypothetical protein
MVCRTNRVQHDGGFDAGDSADVVSSAPPDAVVVCEKEKRANEKRLTDACCGVSLPPSDG